MVTIDVLPYGSQISIGGIAATVLDLRASGPAWSAIEYQVAWWTAGQRWTAWVDASEVAAVHGQASAAK